MSRSKPPHPRKQRRPGETNAQAQHRRFQEMDREALKEALPAPPPGRSGFQCPSCDDTRPHFHDDIPKLVRPP